jgi:hypothetical protein
MTALYQTAVKSFALAMLVLAGGCMGDQNPVRDAFAGVGAGPPQAQTPEFVQQSRRANLDYIPVGSGAAARETAARTKDEVKAAEAELESLRARNEAARSAAIQAGSTPAPEPTSAEPARKRPPPKTPSNAPSKTP